MKQSLSWWCYENQGVDDTTLLRQAKEIGYAGVELITADKFGQALDSGLTIVSHMGHGTIASGLNDPQQHDRIEKEIEASLDLAVKHGIPNLIVFSGNRSPGVSDEEGADHTVAGLRRVARAAEAAGVTLILELLNSKVDHGGYQADHTAWAVDVVEAVGSPRVKVLYDIYHMQVMEGDVIATLGQNHAYIGHYHTAGVPGRHDLDDAQELNYPAIVRAIAATGYDGYLGHEFLPKGDPIAALEAAYRLCDV
jgi:hydroxypyruvate isomerase